MKARVEHLLNRRKYEFLLLALAAHLYSAVFFTNLNFFTVIVWPILMVLVGIASVGVFVEKGRWKNLVRNILFFLVLALPPTLLFLGHIHLYMGIISLVYGLFFAFIFLEIIRFLIRPSYVNADIVSAAACGYLLLVEIYSFLLLALEHYSPGSISDLDTTSPIHMFIDMVYFCSIALTSIGFGDITPTTHHTKLIVSAFGVAGQFYSVVLIGILISKFSSRNRN